MKRDFSKFTKQPIRKEDNPMEQYFGIDTSQNQNNAPSQSIEIEEVVKKATNLIDNGKIGKTGFVVLIAVLLSSAVLFAFQGNWTDVVGAVIFVALVVFLMIKLRYHYNEEINVYLSKVVINLQATLELNRFTKKLMDNAIPIMSWSIVLMTTEHFVLRWFLFSPISSSIYTIAYYSLWLGIAMSVVKRDTKSAYRSLTFAYIYYVLSIMFTAFFSHDLYYFTLITAILIWLFSGWLKNCQIADVKA